MDISASCLHLCCRTLLGSLSWMPDASVYDMVFPYTCIHYRQFDWLIQNVVLLLKALFM